MFIILTYLFTTYKLLIITDRGYKEDVEKEARENSSYDRFFVSTLIKPNIIL